MLERPENHLWDCVFSFLETNGDSVSFDLPFNIPEISVSSSFFYGNYSTNFSHFLLDFWSLFANLQIREKLNDFLPNEIPIFEAPPLWQKEYFDLIYKFRPKFYNDSFQQYNSNSFWFCPSSIVFPVFNNKALSLLNARKFLSQSFDCNLSSRNSNETQLQGRIIFLTRNDSRRDRIKNISELENLVESMGGHVIDPIGYTISERIELFSRPSVFIAESSGCMNFALFAAKKSRLISLVDPTTLDSNQLLFGGYIYNIGYASQTDFLIGSNSEFLAGSVLASAEYSLARIRELIDANMSLLCDQK